LHPKDKIDIQKSLNAGFRGKWGLTSFDIKEGVLQVLSRNSYYDTLSHTRRVVSDYPTELKDRSPRSLHPSQIGFFCLAEGPTGAPIGITKNLAILSTVSISSDATSFLNWLYTKGGVLSVANTSDELRMHISTVSVQLNGGTIGFTTNAVQLIIVLRYMKWTACLTPMASISFSTQEKILRIYVDDGRPLRPLWHLGSGVGKEKWSKVVTSKKALPSWRDMVLGTFPQTASIKGIESTAFFDPLESNPAAPLKEYETLLAPYISCIEYIDLFESNEAYISWYGEENDQLEADHTHAEIHPSVIAGLMVNTLPFPQHNQAARWQYASGQSKQGIGYYATNFDKRFDTYGSIACAAEAPIAHTLYYDAVANGKMPYGLNIVLAFCVMDGYNQEDSQILNRSSVERGMFHSLALRSYELQEGIDEDNKNLETKFGNPIYVKQWTDIRAGYNYSKLDEHGFIRIGEEIDDRTVLIGRYQIDKKTNIITDASIIGKTFTKGRVDKIEVLVQPNGYRNTKIRILEMRIPELGDKFATRHHQKGTIGMLVDAIDMPRTADGIVPDMVMNPHGLPTRMTVAQFYEQIYCKYGSIAGTMINATNFMDKQESLETLGDLLEKEGFQRHGEEIMYNGTEGNQLEASIFMAPCYLMRLKHLTEDKLNSRGKGKKEMLTRQPTAGRGNEGGAKIGEMERDVLIAHGISQFMKESYMKRSDGSTIWICNGCGTVPIFNQNQNLFVCPSCEGGVTFTNELNLVPSITKSRVTFSRVSIPYSYKLFDQELSWQGNMSMRIITEKQGRAFRSIQLKSEPVKPLTLETTAANIAETVTETVASVSNALFGSTPEEGTGVPSVTEEKVIAKANAVLEEPITTAPPVTESTGPTIIIETGGTVETAAPAESAESAAESTAPAAAESTAPAAAEPASTAPAAAAPASTAPAAFTLLPAAPVQKGGARPRISWADTSPKAAESESVTLIKLG
jgi:DNA-directed RNA polymerase beta subunit